MASEHIAKLRRIYGIALSCVAVLAGICLMVACVGIYLSGDEPFSREAVAAAFSPIAIPVYLCLVMAAGGLVLNALCPAPAAKITALKQPDITRNRLLSRADLENCSDGLREQIRAEQQRQKNHRRICALILAASALVFLIYALDGSHFHSSDINGSMIGAMWVLLPCLAVSFAACMVFVAARGKSILREIELLKQCPKKDAQPEPAKSDFTRKVRLALLLAAAALAIFGFCTGGTADVLTKAVNICTECIGLG